MSPLRMLSYGAVFLGLQVLVSTLLMTFPVIVGMVGVKFVEFVAALLWW